MEIVVAKKMIFQLNYPMMKAGELETVAEKMEVLKKHGEVEVLVGFMSGKSEADMPSGGSSWHDYTTYLMTWQRLFPHKKMQPFLDMEYVKRNRKLLAETMKVVRKHGYKAGLQLHTPFFMSEAFFEKYPHLRGPRCDHPRRSRREEFTLCVDHPETLEMFREMSAEMAREIPEVQWMKVMTNDAGAGLCWSDWLYSGVNGPAACRHISTGQRVRKMLDAIKEGAGREIDFVMNGNFGDGELRDMRAAIGDAFHYERHYHEGDTRLVSVGARSENPIKGIFDPLEILEDLAKTRNPNVERVELYFRMHYQRGHDLEDVAERVFEMVDAFYSEPSPHAYGTVERFNLLRKICEKWVGAKKRDELVEALVALREAFKLKDYTTFAHTLNYLAVSTRHLTRPLVIMPEKLTAEEEAHWLPHVFNPHVNEARMDYRDGHGSKLVGGNPMWFEEVNDDPRIKPLDRFEKSVKAVASVLEGMGGTPAGETLKHMGMSLRLYTCCTRSVNNCFSLGAVRDRNLAKLMGPAHVPPKIGDWVGDPDLQLLNGYVRDELDNTAEMIRLLENGGMRQMLVAERAEEEDAFLLGPDLIGQLRKKMAIMRRHWLDAEAYMTMPHK